MKSFLIFYEYSYNEDPGKFSDVMEGESFADAKQKFFNKNKTATVTDIKQLEPIHLNYKDLKNHVHNTLYISKEEIRSMVEKSVDKLVERKLEVMFRKYWAEGGGESEYSLFTMERVIDKAIRDKGLRFWGDSEDSFDDYIKKQVVRELVKGVKLKVEVAKTKEEATETGDGILVYKNRKKQ